MEGLADPGIDSPPATRRPCTQLSHPGASLSIADTSATADTVRMGNAVGWAFLRASAVVADAHRVDRELRVPWYFEAFLAFSASVSVNASYPSAIPVTSATCAISAVQPVPSDDG